MPQAQPAWLQLQGLRAAQASKVALGPNPLPRRGYPWGDGFEPERADTFESGVGQTSAVGAFASGASPYGCEDMAGQVWEWTRSLWGSDFAKPDFKFPYDPRDTEREDLAAPADVLRLVRGGSWAYAYDGARCAYRRGFRPDYHGGNVGFRVVLRSAPVP